MAEATADPAVLEVVEEPVVAEVVEEPSRTRSPRSRPAAPSVDEGAPMAAFEPEPEAGEEPAAVEEPAAEDAGEPQAAAAPDEQQ